MSVMQSEDSSDDRPERKIEWTLAIVLVSALLALSFYACINWKRKSDRSGCIMNIRNVQQGIRGWGGMNNLAPGDSPIDWAVIIGPTGYIPEPKCPAGGIYRFQKMNPQVGVLAMECSLCDSPENHKPDSFADW